MHRQICVRCADEQQRLAGSVIYHVEVSCNLVPATVGAIKLGCVQLGMLVDNWKLECCLQFTIVCIVASVSHCCLLALLLPPYPLQ
jgi:energy-converting hydrogenase Eha subunit H